MIFKISLYKLLLIKIDKMYCCGSKIYVCNILQFSWDLLSTFSE